MTDLRKAAEMALVTLEEKLAILEPTKYAETIEALRQALAQPEQDELIKQGWRQCAIGQRTTQYCGMAEQARLEEREACAKVAENTDRMVLALLNVTSQSEHIAAAIRARSEK